MSSFPLVHSIQYRPSPTQLWSTAYKTLDSKEANDRLLQLKRHVQTHEGVYSYEFRITTRRDRVSYEAGWWNEAWEGIITELDTNKPDFCKVRWTLLGCLLTSSHSMSKQVLTKLVAVAEPPSFEPKKHPLPQPLKKRKDPFEGYTVVGEGTNERERDPFPVDDGKKKPYGAFGAFLENQA